MKKQIAISMSLIILMNTAPVFALESTASGQATANMIPSSVTPGATAGIVYNVSDQIVTDEKMKEYVDMSRQKMYQRVTQIVSGFKAQQQAIEIEKNPTIKKLMRLQALLAIVGSVGIGNDKTNNLLGGKKGVVWIGNISTILNGAISLVRVTSGADGKRMDDKIKTDARNAMAELQAMFNAAGENGIPRSIVKLEGRLRDINDAIQKLEDNTGGTTGAEWARIGSGAVALFFLAGHFLSPKLTDEAETMLMAAKASGKKIQALRIKLGQKTVIGTNIANIIGNPGVEAFIKAFAMTSEEAETETSAIMEKLSTAVEVFQDIANNELKVEGKK